MEGNKMKHISKRIIALALTAFMLMSAVACSRSNSSSDNGTRVQAHNAEVEAAYATTADLNSTRAMSDGFYTEELAGEDYEFSQSAAEPQSAQAGGSTGSVTVSDPVVTDRMLIRYVSVSCETLRFTELTANLETQVAALGGYIESKNFSGTGNAGDLRSATYTIRVSSAALDQLVNQIGDTAVITNTSESTEDVTLSYTDMQARVNSLRIEQDTLNELLAQADSLETILILQDELTNIRYQIESYESQMRVLENLSTYSTLTLSITEVLEETEPEEPHIKTYSEKFSEAWRSGLEDAKEWFEDLGLYVAENAIGIGVKIILLAVAIVVIRIVVKKCKKKNAAKKIDTPAPVKAPETSPAPLEKKD